MKRMAWAAGVLLVVGLAGVAGAQTAQTAQTARELPGARTNDLFETGAWTGSITRSPDRKLVSCQVEADYEDGTTLIFRMTRDWDFSLTLSNPAWDFPPGVVYKVRYYVDKGKPTAATAQVLDPQTVRIPLPGGDKAFSSMWRGRTLYIATEQRKTLDYGLDGTAVALTGLWDCVNRGTAFEAPGGRNPFGPSQ